MGSAAVRSLTESRLRLHSKASSSHPLALRLLSVLSPLDLFFLRSPSLAAGLAGSNSAPIVDDGFVTAECLDSPPGLTAFGRFSAGGV